MAAVTFRPVVEWARLPGGTRENVQDSLARFRKRSDEHTYQDLASWIDHEQVQLDWLDLTTQELEGIAPYLSVAVWGGKDPTFVPWDRFSSLKTLYFLQTGIRQLPTLPPHLEAFICHEEYLFAIEGLPESITRLNCSGCASLRHIICSSNMRMIDCKNCINLDFIKTI